MSQTFSSSSCRCGLMLTLTTNLAVWMSAVTDESVHKAHSKLKKNMTEEIFRWLLKGNLPLCKAIWSKERSHQVEIVPQQVRFYPFSEGLFRARGTFVRTGLLKAKFGCSFPNLCQRGVREVEDCTNEMGLKEKERFNLMVNFLRKNLDTRKLRVKCPCFQSGHICFCSLS